MNLARLGAATATGVLAMSMMGCGTGSGPAKPSGPLAGQTIEIEGVWSGDEQKAFEKVLDLFQQQTGATVHYTSEGDNLPTVLQTKVQGKNPPNVALLAQPGAIAQFAKEGALKPLPDDVQQEVKQHQSPVWGSFGTVAGKPYGVYFAAADKSVVWYNAKAFASVGASEPKTWPEFLAVSNALADSGTAAMSIGGADGWVLTDWFEQVYLQTAGLDNYNKLGKHQIPWTDPTVTTALKTLSEYFNQDRLIAGGRSGALQTDFSTSVANTFGDKPKAGMVYEADFVSTAIQSSTKAMVGADAKVFRFPQLGSATPGVESAGDAAVAFTDDKATAALLKFLATPEAGSVFTKSGGFLTPNKDIPLTDYGNDVIRGMEQQLLGAGDNIVFDMSDQEPAAFGGTKGQGEWKDLEDFLANPADIAGTQQKLEADAAKSSPTS